MASDTTQGLAKALESKNRIHIEIVAEPEVAMQIFERIEGVQSVEKTESTKENCVTEDGIEILKTVSCSFEVIGELEEDIRPRLFYACAEADMPILSMSCEKNSLEDIFLELTGEEVFSETDADKKEEA